MKPQRLSLSLSNPVKTVIAAQSAQKLLLIGIWMTERCFGVVFKTTGTARTLYAVLSKRAMALLALLAMAATTR
jgi:hypothetical protein